MKKRRIALTFLALAGLCLLLLALVLVPDLIEQRMNRTRTTSASAPDAATQALHARLLIGDLHADTLLWNRDLLRHSTTGHVDLPRLQIGNVALQVFSVVTKTPSGQNYDHTEGGWDQVTALNVLQLRPPRTWFSLRARALDQAARFDAYCAASDGRLVPIRSGKDLEEFLVQREETAGLVAGILAIEGLHCLEGRVEVLDEFYDVGFRILAPVHFFDNELGGSAHGAVKGGLTPFGREVLLKMAEKKMLLDLAHASPQLMEDALALAHGPVIVSHTGVQGTCDNPRNLSDAQIAAIAATGGLIGIGYWSGATCGTEVEDIVRAMRYTVDLAGIDHVALGSDFDGATAVPFDASGLILLTDGLLRAGFSEAEIAKVMGENLLRVLRAGLPEA